MSVYSGTTYQVKSGSVIRKYPEVFLFGIAGAYYSSDFQLIWEHEVQEDTDKRIDAIRKTDEEIHANFWRIQGDILGSME